ncbi:putative Hydantoin racemase (hyuE) [Oenococcus oeni]|uniref:aspartate/glutamate racemase family protein n=1 Tax=Oenococcus oeni TaxID=1247 RepID=UPI0010781984|nr:aspartate/glutamate racemase family protein [Oenococcus oeni]AVI94642.1 hydantoin racemase [Oenococcus oeni]SYV98982.1 putative Hydantoin racemase (hyuE) [Oenococcus oeni]SYW02438.1 putative Hydantoin racemase (hyuE) [Oenococcus oeni]VDC15235.1 putative Hydantoin racemase (hyuE) [Oenococcus oeni]
MFQMLQEKKNMIGLIRVITFSDVKLINYHGNLIRNKYNLSIVSECIKNQDKGIHDDVTERKAVPKIIDLGKRMADSGCDLIIVSCAADPAVKQLRSRIDIPVIGAGSSASLVALANGKRTGVIGITEEVPAIIKETLGVHFQGYLRPDGIDNTNDLLSKSGQEACAQAVKQLISGGAEQILFACTGMGTINLKDILNANHIEVPLIDAVDAEGLFASFYSKRN